MKITLHALQRYAERVMGLGADLYLTKEQREALNDKILEDVKDYIPIIPTTNMVIKTGTAAYVVKDEHIVSVNDGEPSHTTKYGGITRGSKKKYKDLRNKKRNSV